MTSIKLYKKDLQRIDQATPFDNTERPRLCWQKLEQCRGLIGLTSTPSFIQSSSSLLILPQPATPLTRRIDFGDDSPGKAPRTPFSPSITQAPRISQSLPEAPQKMASLPELLSAVSELQAMARAMAEVAHSAPDGIDIPGLQRNIDTARRAISTQLRAVKRAIIPTSKGGLLTEVAAVDPQTLLLIQLRIQDTQDNLVLTETGLRQWRQYREEATPIPPSPFTNDGWLARFGKALRRYGVEITSYAAILGLTALAVLFSPVWILFTPAVAVIDTFVTYQNKKSAHLALRSFLHLSKIEDSVHNPSYESILSLQRVLNNFGTELQQATHIRFDEHRQRLQGFIQRMEAGQPLTADEYAEVRKISATTRAAAWLFHGKPHSRARAGLGIVIGLLLVAFGIISLFFPVLLPAWVPLLMVFSSPLLSIMALVFGIGSAVAIAGASSAINDSAWNKTFALPSDELPMIDISHNRGLLIEDDAAGNANALQVLMEEHGLPDDENLQTPRKPPESKSQAGLSQDRSEDDLFAWPAPARHEPAQPPAARPVLDRNAAAQKLAIENLVDKVTLFIAGNFRTRRNTTAQSLHTDIDHLIHQYRDHASWYQLGKAKHELMAYQKANGAAASPSATLAENPLFPSSSTVGFPQAVSMSVDRNDSQNGEQPFDVAFSGRDAADLEEREEKERRHQYFLEEKTRPKAGQKGEQRENPYTIRQDIGESAQEYTDRALSAWRIAAESEAQKLMVDLALAVADVMAQTAEGAPKRNWSEILQEHLKEYQKKIQQHAAELQEMVQRANALPKPLTEAGLRDLQLLYTVALDARMQEAAWAMKLTQLSEGAIHSRLKSTRSKAQYDEQGKLRPLDDDSWQEVEDNQKEVTHIVSDISLLLTAVILNFETAKPNYPETVWVAKTGMRKGVNVLVEMQQARDLIIGEPRGKHAKGLGEQHYAEWLEHLRARGQTAPSSTVSTSQVSTSRLAAVRGARVDSMDHGSQIENKSKKPPSSPSGSGDERDVESPRPVSPPSPPATTMRSLPPSPSMTTPASRRVSLAASAAPSRRSSVVSVPGGDRAPSRLLEPYKEDKKQGGSAQHPRSKKVVQTEHSLQEMLIGFNVFLPRMAGEFNKKNKSYLRSLVPTSQYTEILTTYDSLKKEEQESLSVAVKESIQFMREETVGLVGMELKVWEKLIQAQKDTLMSAQQGSRKSGAILSPTTLQTISNSLQEMMVLFALADKSIAVLRKKEPQPYGEAFKALQLQQKNLANSVVVEILALTQQMFELSELGDEYVAEARKMAGEEGLKRKMQTMVKDWGNASQRAKFAELFQQLEGIIGVVEAKASLPSRSSSRHGLPKSRSTIVQSRDQISASLPPSQSFAPGSSSGSRATKSPSSLSSSSVSSSAGSISPKASSSSGSSVDSPDRFMGNNRNKKKPPAIQTQPGKPDEPDDDSVVVHRPSE